MSNSQFELNNINNMGIGYLFEKELNIQDNDINKLLSDLDSQIKGLHLQEEVDSLNKNLFNSPTTDVEPDFWAMTEEWAKQYQPQIEAVEPRKEISSVTVEPIKETPKLDSHVLFEVNSNKTEQKTDEVYVSNEAQRIRTEKPETHYTPAKQVNSQPEEQKEFSKPLAVDPKTKKEIDVYTVIYDRSVAMQDTHTSRMEAAKNSGDLNKVMMATDRNRIEKMQFEVTAKETCSQYLAENFAERAQMGATKSDKDILSKSKLDFYDKYGEGKFTQFLSKDDIEMGAVKSKEVESKRTINSDRSSKSFGHKNNTIDVTHPDLDYGLMLQKAEQFKEINTKNTKNDLNSTKDLEKANRYKQPRDFFNNYNIPGENKNMREHMDWLKNPNNKVVDSNKFSSHFYDARKSMENSHQEGREKILLNPSADDKTLKLYEQQIGVEQKLFNIKEKEAMVEERLHFSQQNNNLGYQEYANNPQKAINSFGPKMEEKQDLYNAHTQYYLESKNLVLNNDNISEGRQALHQEQTKDLMNSTYNSDDWKSKRNTHVVENFQQDIIDGKVSGNTMKQHEEVLRNNFEPGKNYNVRIYDDKSKDFNTMSFSGKEDTPVYSQKPQEIKIEKNLDTLNKDSASLPKLNEVQNNISNIRNKADIKSPQIESSNKRNIPTIQKERGNTQSVNNPKVETNSKLNEFKNESKFKTGVISEHTQKTPNQAETLGNKQNTKEFNLDNAKKPYVGKEIDLEQREISIKKKLSDSSLGY